MLSKLVVLLQYIYSFVFLNSAQVLNISFVLKLFYWMFQLWPIVFLNLCLPFVDLNCDCLSYPNIL